MPRPVNPSEFADAPTATPTSSASVGKRLVDPSEFADAPATPHTPSAPEAPGFLDRLGMSGGLSGLFHTAKDVITGAPGARAGFASGAGEAAQAVAPTVARIGSGVLGAEGGLPGAAIAGGGEGLAQLFEGKFDPARIAVASGTGAIPFGSVVKQGRVATSALRSGALAGTGETAREALSGETFDPKQVGMATAIGAGGGAGASGLGRLFGMSPKVGKVLTAEEEAAQAAGKGSLADRAKERLRQAEMNDPKVKKQAALDANAAENEWYDVKDAGEKFHSSQAVAKGKADQAAAAKQAAAAQKQAAEKAAQDRINQTITEGGLVPGTPRINEAATGKKSMSTPFGPPSEEAAAEAAITGKTFTPEEYARFNEPDVSDIAPVSTGVKPAPAVLDPEAQALRDQTAPTQSPLAKTLGVEPPMQVAKGPNVSAIDELPSTNPQSNDFPATFEGGQTPASMYGEVASGQVPQQSKSDFLQSPEVQGILSGAAPEEKAAQSPLAKFFKSKVGAAGENYGQAKVAEKAGEIPSADLAHQAFARERSALGQTTAPRGQGRAKPGVAAPVAPETPTPVTQTAPQAAPGTGQEGIGTGPTGDWVKDQSTLAETALQDPSLRASLLKRAQEEKGLATPGLQQLLGAGTGAAIGAPIGSYAYGDEDKLGAVKGGLIGAGLGSGIMSPTGRGVVNNALNLRASSMLTSPNTLAKSYLGDASGHFWESVKHAIPGEVQDTQYAKDLFNQLPMMRPREWGKDVLQGMKQSTPSRSAMGQGMQQSPNSVLDMVYRPLSASNYATEKGMSAAGTPLSVIEKISGISDPETQAMKQLVAMQGQNPLFRAMWPFMRVGANIAEGARNIPGISLIAGNPADKWSRTGVGAIQMGLGAGSEMYDESQADAGTPTGNLSKALRANAMGIQGTAPYAAGYAIPAVLNNTSASAIRELLQLIPGTQATFSPPYPGESSQQYLIRVGGKMGGSMIPSFLRPDPGTVR